VALGWFLTRSIPPLNNSTPGVFQRGGLLMALRVRPQRRRGTRPRRRRTSPCAWSGRGRWCRRRSRRSCRCCRRRSCRCCRGRSCRCCRRRRCRRRRRCSRWHAEGIDFVIGTKVDSAASSYAGVPLPGAGHQFVSAAPGIDYGACVAMVSVQALVTWKLDAGYPYNDVIGSISGRNRGRTPAV